MEDLYCRVLDVWSWALAAEFWGACRMACVFFSSRRRHTRFDCDWSSDVCSSDLAFFWPSLVRVGPEAARFRERVEGTEGTSGMSSPKRYLCDVEPVNQEWRFQPSDKTGEGRGGEEGRNRGVTGPLKKKKKELITS